jgi:hypothetical protein
MSEDRMPQEEKALGADAAAVETAGNVQPGQLSHADLIAQRDKYRRALENHLCAHDMADWLGCSFNHNEACAICQHDNGTEHTWLVRAERAEAEGEKLRRLLNEVVIQWRSTADVWERHNNDYRCVPNRDGYEMAPQKGTGAVKNWINWLRGCASEIETVIGSASQPLSEASGSVPSAAPKDSPV